MIWYLSELKENPEAFFVFLAAFLVAVLTGLAFHEFSHAWTANELGDDTAARQGRLTLNPLAHLDPIGTTLLLFVGFGWAKPTPVNPYRLRNGPHRGTALVSLAGPASNFFFATVAALPLKLGLVHSDYTTNIDAVIRFGSGLDLLWLFLYFIVSLNILLGLFNLIPIPPLDGFKVVTGILPRELARPIEQLAPWGPGILMSLLVVSWVTPYNPIFWLIGGVGGQIFRLLV
jgi:Zn-dependent protease